MVRSLSVSKLEVIDIVPYPSKILCLAPWRILWGNCMHSLKLSRNLLLELVSVKKSHTISDLVFTHKFIESWDETKTLAGAWQNSPRMEKGAHRRWSDTIEEVGLKRCPDLRRYQEKHSQSTNGTSGMSAISTLHFVFQLPLRQKATIAEHNWMLASMSNSIETTKTSQA